MRSDLENGTTVSSTACPPSAETLQNAPDLACPCSASNENSCFKENINYNKSDTPKLSLEPQQMKRKKKGGGYNLRKSLAWDRAFFTEEGILDPLELSTISDVSCREDDDFGKDRKQDWSSPKLDSSSSHYMTSSSLTSHKFPTHLGVKPGSRFGDCPRPLPSPSLKRPANAVKTAGKELKLPKVHGLNPGFTPTSATTRSTILRANRVKHNQIIQPDFGIQRHAEPKSSSKSLKNIKNASRAITLQSARHSDGNSGNSSLRRYSPISMSSPMVDKAGNSASKMHDNATTIRPETSSKSNRYDSTTFEAPIPQRAHVGGKPMHPLANIMAKPTGLRIPSPSLSFFSQPKPLVYRDLPQRITEPDGFGAQKPENLRLQDNLRMPMVYSRIPESPSISSKSVSSKSECIVSSHASAVESIKPNLEHNPMHKIQDRPNKNIIARISYEAELQKIGIEVPSQTASCESTMDEVLKKGMDGYPETSESGGSERTNAEFGSKQNYAIQESEKICAINAPLKEKRTEIYLVLDQGSSQCADALDRVQNALTMPSDLRKNFKPDCGEPHKENTYPLNDSLAETDKTENPYFRSSHQHADPLKLSASVEVLTENLPSGEVHMQNSVFASTIEGCENGINLMPEAGDDIEPPRNSFEVQTISHEIEMELEKRLESNTSERLSPEKAISCQNSHQIENVEKHLFVVQERKDRDEVTGKRMPISLSPGRKHYSNLGKETIIAESLTSTVSDSVNDSVSSESSISLINAVLDCDDKHQGNANALSNGTTHESHFPHQDTQRMDIGDSCPFSESRNHQLSQKGTTHESRFSHQDTQRMDICSSCPLPESMNHQLSQKGTTHESHFPHEDTQGMDIGSSCPLPESRNHQLSKKGSTRESHFPHEDDTQRMDTGSSCPLPESRNHQLSQKGTTHISQFRHEDTQRMYIGNYCPLPESRNHQLSQKDTLGKEAEDMPCIESGTADNWLISTMPLGDNESDSNNRGLWDTDTLLVQSPESNMLSGCSPKLLECMEIPCDRFVADNSIHTNNQLQAEGPADDYSEDNALGRTEDSVKGQDQMHLRASNSPNLSVKESHSKNEICNKTVDHTADAITDPSGVKPWSDTVKDEVSENTISSLKCLDPKLDHVMVEAAPAPSNKLQNGLNKKSRLLVIPQNAVPFSDEWLAAIEAAGEDILTRKSGKVQHSPPDKSVPEPSPWSPVKRKNNQIGPFDCTKFTAPSENGT